MIHALIDTTKVIGNTTIGGAPYEVYAEAVANHDRGGDKLTVNLSAFLRSVRRGQEEQTPEAAWLPAP